MLHNSIDYAKLHSLSLKVAHLLTHSTNSMFQATLIHSLTLRPYY